MKNRLFRDPAVKDADAWRVLYNGRVVPGEFNSKGAARAHLDLLERGYYTRPRKGGQVSKRMTWGEGCAAMVEGKLVTRPELDYVHDVAIGMSGDQLVEFVARGTWVGPGYMNTGVRYNVTDSDKESTEWRVVE